MNCPAGYVCSPAVDALTVFAIFAGVGVLLIAMGIMFWLLDR